MIFSTRPRFILTIGDDGAFLMPQNIAHMPASFFAAAGNRAAEDDLMRLIAKHPRASALLAGNALAQDLRQEELPHLGLFDRAKLVRRRLMQAFPQARAAAYLKLSASRILMAGLHDDSPVFAWLERLKDRSPELALLPVECAGIAARLVPDAGDWLMLIARLRSGGFRQLVTHKGRLIFTRLTPNPGAGVSEGEIVEILARDIKASLGYLGRLGLANAQALDAVLLMPEVSREQFKAQQLPLHDFKLIAPAQAAQRLGLRRAADGDGVYSDMLFAEWMATRRKPLLPLTVRDIKNARLTRRLHDFGMRAATALLLIAASIVGMQAIDLYNLHDANQAAAAQLAATRRELVQQQTQTASGEPLDRLRQALARQRLFTEPQAMPWASLSSLGQGLSGVRLTKLTWQNDGGEAMQLEVQIDPAQDREAVAAHVQEVAQTIAKVMPDFKTAVARYPFPALPQEAVTNTTADKMPVLENSSAEITLRRLP